MAHDHPDDGHHHPDGQHPPSDMHLRVKALESVLVEKGLVDPVALDAIVEHYAESVGPKNGALRQSMMRTTFTP
jgi:nitrile hydratase subunit alpha